MRSRSGEESPFQANSFPGLRTKSSPIEPEAIEPEPEVASFWVLEDEDNGILDETTILSE